MAKTQNSINFAAATNNQFAIGLTSAGPNALDVNGGVGVGSYAGTNTAPSGGLIVSGKVGIGNSSPSATLTVTGTASASTSVSSPAFITNGTSSGNVTIESATGTYNFILPATSGTSGYFLTSAAGGTLTWSAPTSVTVSITGDTGGPLASNSFTFTGSGIGLSFVGSGTTFTLSGTLGLANGGVGANLTASNGGIFYSTASAGAILSGTATPGQMLQSGASTTPAWSTTTWPATTSVNTLLYSSSASVIGQITAANNGVLISGTGGIPSWLAAGTTGQVLVATTSSPASWGTLSSMAVTSIAGTANQIVASSSTGNVTLSFPATGGISVGSYQANNPPTGGILAPGEIIIGNTAPVLGASGTMLIEAISTSGNAIVAAETFSSGNSSGGFYCIGAGGTPSSPSATQSGYQIGRFSGGGYTGSAFGNGSAVIFMYANATWTSSDNSSYITFDTTPSGTTSRVERIRIAASGDIGINDTAPASLLSVVGNAQIGFSSGTTAPSNGLVVSGPSYFGSSSIIGTNPFVQITPTLTIGTPGGGTTCAGLILDGGTYTFNANNNSAYNTRLSNITLSTNSSNFTGLTFYNLALNNSAVSRTGNGTFTNAYGVYSDAFSSIATNQYAGYFVAPTGATSNTALYADNMSIGYTATTPPTNGLVVSGQVSFGSSSAPGEANFYTGAVWTTVSGSAIEGNYFNQTLEPASNVTNATNTFINPVYNTTNGSITSSRSLWINANSKIGSNAITNSYSLYVLDPLVGATSNTAIYADNMSIGYTATTPPRSGLLVSGQVVVGGSSAINPASLTSTLEMQATESQCIAQLITADNAGGSASSAVVFTQSRGTITSPTASIANDRLGALSFTGYNSSAYTSGKAIFYASAYNNWSTNDNSTYFKFGTTPSGSTSRNDWLYFGPGITVGINDSAAASTLSVVGNAQIGFSSGTTAPSNGLVVAGNVQIGTSTISLSSTDIVTIVNPNNSNALAIIGTNSTSSTGPSLELVHNTGLATASGDRLGSIAFGGTSDNASTYVQNKAGIFAFASENWTTSANGSYLSIQTTTPTTTSRVERMRITANSSGNALVGINDSSPASTLSVVGNSQIGFGSGTTAPANGLIVSGQVAVGTSSIASTQQVNFTTTNAVNLQMSGTQTSQTSGTNQVCLSVGSVSFSPTTNAGSCYTINVTGNMAPPAGVTITNGYGINVSDIPNSGSGTVTNCYGIRVINPAAGGSSNTALYADNVSIGYLATTPPSNGLIVSGQVGVGTSSPSYPLQISGTTTTSYQQYITGAVSGQDGGSNTAGLYIDINVESTVSGNSYAQFIYPNINPPAGKTAGTAAGLIISTGAQSGTITNMYGLYVQNPAGGTNKAAIYTDNISIGYTGTTPPSNGLIISGNTAFGTSNATNLVTVGVAGSASGELIRINGTNAQSYMSFYNSTTRQGYLGTNSAGSGLILDSDVTSLTLQAEGNPCYIVSSFLGSSGGVSIGSSYYTTTPPSNGLIVSGQVGIGASGPNGNSKLNVVSTGAYNTLLNGTQTLTDSGSTGNQLALLVETTFSPTGSPNAIYGIYCGIAPIVASGQTASSVFGMQINTNVGSNVGTITNLYGLQVAAGSAASSPITYSYGGYFTNPAATGGSSTIALYADNASIGYSQTTPSTNGLIVSGKVGIGTSLIDSGVASLQCASALTTTNAGYAYGILWNGSFTPASGATGQLRAISSQGTFAIPNSQTVTLATALYLSSAFNTNTSGTLTNYYGIYIDSNSTVGSGTLGRLYSGWMNTSSVGISDTSSNGVYGLVVNGVDSVGGTARCINLLTLQGTITGDDTDHQAGLSVSPTLNSTNNKRMFGILSAPSYIISSGTGGNNYNLYLGSLLSSNAGNLGNLFELYITPGTTLGGSLNSYYSMYVKTPTVGTNKYTAVLGDTSSALVGINDATPGSMLSVVGNAQIGFSSGTSAPSGGLIVSGQVGIGTSSVLSGIMVNINAYLTTPSSFGTSGELAALLINPQLIPAGGTTGQIAGVYCYAGLYAPSTHTIASAMCYYSSPYLGSNAGTITNLYGYFADTVSATAGTVTNSYGGYFNNPGYGTNQVALYAANLSVGVAASGTPTAGTIRTAPPSSNTVTTAFGTSLTLGTAVQNTTGYDILVNVAILVQSGTLPTITLGVGPTSTPTTNTVIPLFTVITGEILTFSAYVPNKYYLLVGNTGTITTTDINVMAMAI